MKLSSGGSIVEAEAPLGLDEHEPEKYYGIWQYPEGRFTHFGVGPPGSGSSWILLCASEIVANIYIGFDALDNARTTSQYEARRLSLPEAFEEVRHQALPIVYSTGDIYTCLAGVAIFDLSGTRLCITDLLPL